ncbi:hypothetical protein F0L74_17710 [Chitinophaga agrisoli]|uniref:Uncharacterized protein n=1 Tax=Chitinophaga agrisoli TaxID=2607653 RepID=A0A5B2VR75_9BACT|nr:hypothetical protein [Chitinophaga agrisoli]KAA2241711.1 hypothetical protein F0L74_17710 [Chitinophaga agrisoli]
MKTQSLLTLAAIFAALLFSCSKDNDPAPPKLQKMSVTNATADADPTGGANSTCFSTYSNTVRNPPSGYIPGTAEADLNTCLETNWDISQGAPGPRQVPPAPPIVLTPAPPSLPPINTTPPPVDDNLAYLKFFNVQGYGFDLFSRTLDEARQLFDRYCQIVCAAITENINWSNPNYVDKSVASVIYATNHPEVFQSAEDKDMFLRFLGLVFAKDTFLISLWGSPDTGGIINLASGKCVNLWGRIPPFPFHPR